MVHFEYKRMLGFLNTSTLLFPALWRRAVQDARTPQPSSKYPSLAAQARWPAHLRALEAGLGGGLAGAAHLPRDLSQLRGGIIPPIHPPTFQYSPDCDKSPRLLFGQVSLEL